jgi:hypothetical protein
MTYREQYEQEQKRLVDDYKAIFLREYPAVKEVTTPTQLKNGTTMFEVTENNGDISKFASYKSGMVRRIVRTRFGELTCYQLNPQRKTTGYHAILNEKGKVVVLEYLTTKRVPIYKELARLVFLKEYLVKNTDIESRPTWEYVTKVNDDYIVINGVEYKKV